MADNTDDDEELADYLQGQQAQTSSAPAPGVQRSNMIKQYMEKMYGDQQKDEALGRQSQQNAIGANLMKDMMQAGNEMGTIGGKTASTPSATLDAAGTQNAQVQAYLERKKMARDKIMEAAALKPQSNQSAKSTGLVTSDGQLATFDPVTQKVMVNGKEYTGALKKPSGDEKPEKPEKVKIANNPEYMTPDKKPLLMGDNGQMYLAGTMEPYKGDVVPAKQGPSKDSKEIGEIEDQFAGMKDLDDVENEYIKDAASTGSGISSYVPGTEASQYKEFVGPTGIEIGKKITKNRVTAAEIPMFKNLIPTPNDNNANAAKKIEGFRARGMNEIQKSINELKAKGADTSDYEAKLAAMQASNRSKIRDVPSFFGGADTSAAAQDPASQSAPHPQDNAAVQWAKSNIDVPQNKDKAVQILKLNGVSQ